MYELKPCEHTPGVQSGIGARPNNEQSVEYDRIVSSLQESPNQWFTVIEDDVNSRATDRIRSALSLRGCKTSRPTRLGADGERLFTLKVCWASDGSKYTNPLLARRWADKKVASTSADSEYA